METLISPAQMKIYAQTAQARSKQRRKQLEARRQRAWEVARRSAVLLKQEFGASRVVLFGSLARGPGRFFVRSDVDLAVWGMDERLYLRAVGRLLDLDPEIKADLIEAEYARSAVKTAIERDGVEL
ncbi:MAG: nucleotidyltransferase domain-containing protein [Chloroflexi bacterium]|nr:nucleotidyltransferase domain-containing protein [Chloroflexota bacterium]